MREEKGKNRPTVDEIHRRAFEIHIENGNHDYDFNEFMDEWLQAERELQDQDSDE